MFTLLRSVPLRRLLLQQLPSLTLSLIVADTFYKFHSFLLETGAFLATWLVIDAVASTAIAALARIRNAPQSKIKSAASQE